MAKFLRDYHKVSRQEIEQDLKDNNAIFSQSNVNVEFFTVMGRKHVSEVFTVAGHQDLVAFETKLIVYHKHDI